VKSRNSAIYQTGKKDKGQRDNDFVEKEELGWIILGVSLFTHGGRHNKNVERDNLKSGSRKRMNG